MIVVLLLIIPFTLAQIILGLFPVVTLPSGITEFITTGVQAMVGFYNLLPATFFAILGFLVATLTVEGAIAIYKATKWGYTKVPGIK